MLMHDVGTGKLHLHAMASLEPLTIGSKGYPLLLQTGESYQGQPLHDRQHPHDIIMELAAMFQQPIASDLAVELYGGLAGEPALGPVAFMHRPSAQNDPFAPLGHHWQDATHISYGVFTAGLYSRVWKLEGSWFNGREPNENRWNLDLRRLDSYSGRLTVNPTGRASLAGWYGYLPSPEWLHPEEQVHRYGVSALYGGNGIAGGSWGSMLLWGANRSAGHVENSMAAETNLEIGVKNAVFARAEYVRKSAEELVLPALDPGREFDIRSLVGGYVHEVASVPGGSIGVGARASVNFVPSSLEPYYGTRSPAGVAVYVRVRPRRMALESAMPMAERGVTGSEQGGVLKVPRPNDSHPSMPGMPGMTRGPDSARRMPLDTTMRGMTHDSTMHPMAHDSTKSPTWLPMDSTMHTSHDTTMQAMPMRSGTKVARPKTGSVPKAASKAKAASRAKAASKAKAVSKSSTKTRSKRKARPATGDGLHGHDMPGMKMPGMQMPADTGRTRRP